MQKMRTFLLLSTCGLARLAVAEPIPGLASYFDQKVAQVQRAVDNLDSSGAQTFVFQDMNIDIAPEVSFGLNSVLSLTVAPEIDFVLTPPVKSGN